MLSPEGRRPGVTACYSTVPRVLVVREFEQLSGLHEDDRRDLEEFALALRDDDPNQRRFVFAVRNGRLYAQNYVGIVETRRGTVIEILPKIDLSNDAAGKEGGKRTTGSDSESGTATNADTTRRVFLSMLRNWRGLQAAEFDSASIRAIERFNMFETFVHLFLASVILLTRRGLARTYRTREANLSCLRGRILFPQHVRENVVDRSRFYVGYDEFTADRPENRLIHIALRQLAGAVRQPANRQRIHQLRIALADVPYSTNLADDWERHRVDRSMRHYEAVMPWVELFLFGKGLATFSGKHVNRAILFPMEEVFEDFVTAAVHRHQRRYTVNAQGPTRHLATSDAGKNKVFRMKPDIALLENGNVRFILDAKWKRLSLSDSNYGVQQSDAYQIFAYGKRYGCRRVVLVYPRTDEFRETLNFRFTESNGLELVCFPFNVAAPAEAVGRLIKGIHD